MKYVALLRGINVGGKARVEMKRLRVVFEDLGLGYVRTYINSGNVIFTSDLKEKALEKRLEKAIEKEFGFFVPVLVRSEKHIAEIAEAVPAKWTNDTEMKTDVIFLWDEANQKEEFDKLIIKPDIDNVKFFDGVLIWNVSRKLITRSGLLKIVGTPFYKKATIRNINTLRKLDALLKEAL